MAHEALNREKKIQGPSNRSFGVVFAAVFAIIALLPLIDSRPARVWSLGVAAGFAALAFAAPRFLAPLNRLWLKLGLLLHKVVNPIVLAIMFFLVVTPTALLMRMLRKDPLRLKRDPSARSYWIERAPPGPKPDSLRDQF